MGKYYVYEIIYSSGFIYVGITKNLSQRMYNHRNSRHNTLGVIHARKRNIDMSEGVSNIVAKNLNRENALKVEILKIVEYQKKGISLNVAGRTDLPPPSKFNKINLSKYV